MYSTVIQYQFSSGQSLSCVRLFVTPWIAARQVSLSITNSWSSLRLMSIESVMPSSHLILCRPLLLLPPIPPSIRVFSNESTLRMRWPKYWSFSFSIIPSKEIPVFRTPQKKKRKGKVGGVVLQAYFFWSFNYPLKPAWFYAGESNRSKENCRGWRLRKAWPGIIRWVNSACLSTHHFRHWSHWSS